MKLSLTPLVALVALASTGCTLLGGNSAINGTQPGIGNISAQGARPVGYIYTTLYGKNAVMEINNTQSRANPDPILVPNGPRALAVDPRGIQQYLYVVCEVANSVAVVDRRSRQVVRSINVGRRPYAIAMTPDGNRAFVTNSDDDTVSVIDTTSNNVVSTLQLVPSVATQPVGTTGQVSQPVRLNPKGIASNGNGTRIYVACAGGYMVELDGAPPTTSATTGLSSGGQAYTAARNLPLTGAVSPLNVAVASDITGTTVTDSVYVSDPSGNKIFYVAANATTANPVQASGEPWGLAVHRNSTGKADRLYVTQSSLNAVLQYSLPDLGSGGQGANIEGHNPQAIACSPVGDEIYVSVTGDNNVAVMNVGSNGVLTRPSYFQTNTLNQEFVTSTGEIALGGFLF